MTTIDFIQTIAILFTIIFTWYQLRDLVNLRRFETFWRVGESHRSIWTLYVEQPELVRVLDPEADVETEPVTTRERQFIVSVLIHTEMVHKANDAGYYELAESGNNDIADFLALPLPACVWEDVRQYQPPAFVSFIESLINQRKE